MDLIALTFSTYIKLFIIMTPFFVMSVFLSLTDNVTTNDRHNLAIKVTKAIIISGAILLIFGRYIFDLFGITLDAFRIGAGALLFLSAVSLSQGAAGKVNNKDTQEGTPLMFAVVPLAIPITIGPATVGALMVIGADLSTFTELASAFVSLLLASCSVGALLYLSSHIENMIGKNGIVIMSKITGLLLSALSAQMVFTGIKGFLLL